MENDTIKTAKWVKGIPNRTTKSCVGGIKTMGELNRHYRALEDEDKAMFILKAACYVLSTSIGFVAGNNIPDKDIKMLGIGRHRSALTHSIIPTVAIGLLSRFLIRFFEAVKKYHDNHESIGFLITNLKCIAFGGAVGMAYHLGIDGTVEGQKAVTTPFSNTFVREMTCPA